MDGINEQSLRRRKRTVYFNTINIQGNNRKLKEILGKLDKVNFKVKTLIETK